MDSKEKGDDRFSLVYTDPRFRTLRKKDKKLKIDNRFKSMFTEDKFRLKYSMDKRGRSRKHLISEDYKKFYRLDDDDDKKKPVEASEEPSGQEEEEPSTSRKLTHEFGYHRGLKDAEEDEESSSSSESEEEPEQEEELEHDWGQLDKDAEEIDQATSRIAICNADWDRINAQDLYVLLNSFKRPTGVIHSVRLYYSKFGEERLQVEEEKGPSQFIFGQAKTITEEEDEEPEDENSAVDESEATEKLRKYQLERLKYFYAVVECDSTETAESIYNELDGLEYECSSSTLDIRFIPDGMTFDDVRLKQECTSMPNASTYKAPTFTNTALQQSNVKITWDQNDPKRINALNKAFEEDNEDDIRAYLATSSSEDEGPDEPVGIDQNMPDKDKISKYKNLLSTLDKESQNDDIDLEVSWVPKLRTNSDNDSDHQNSDLDESSRSEPSKNGNKKAPKKKIRKNVKKDGKTEVNSEDASNLELMMMDMEDGSDKKKHFNYKEIIENYKRDAKDVDDGFKFDPEDARFSSIYDSHLYNIDQTDPNFKRTKAFEEILKKRKQKAAHLLIENGDDESPVTKASSKNNAKRQQLNSLIQKVKTPQLNKRFRG